MPQEFADGQATDPGPAMILSQNIRECPYYFPIIFPIIFEPYFRATQRLLHLPAPSPSCTPKTRSIASERGNEQHYRGHGPLPRAQPGRIKTELTGASIVFGAGHARDELLDVPIVPQDFLPAWNIRECPYFPGAYRYSMRGCVMESGGSPSPARSVQTIRRPGAAHR